MSTIGADITPCPVFQRALVDYFRTCPLSRRMGTPTLIWSNSPENKSGIQTLIQPIPGKKFTARLVFTQPIPMSDIEAVESCDKVCDATTSQGDSYADYTIDCTDGLRAERQVTLSDWNESCKGNNEIIMETTMNMLDGLIPAVAEKQAAELNPLVGAWSSDVPSDWLTGDVLEVATKYAGGTNNFQWFERIHTAKEITGYCGPTFITGGLDLYSAWKLQNAGCCTSDGFDALELLRLYGEAVVYDRWIAAEFGSTSSLMIQSNSIQLLSAVFNTAPLQLGSMVDLDLTYRNGWMGVIMDPVTGIPVDLNIKEDCGVVHIVMTATTKTVGLPLAMYPTGHPNDGVVFVNQIDVVNP